ncbi:hypothetical protein [Acidovorax sp. Leaf160]|uniref:hypothetical protein n=1 Tax=Acidovorax sp. Leaf160 TaxID=1736280 RepID=UPI0006F3F23F|nr:hypothetical protein [Acidovorax sp. Leaf160]KQR62640.1 hypothetical protein ASF94_15585 [Acidovorax sp. Leaf160]
MNTAHLVRAHDPLSSVLAAERTPQFAGGHCARILAALRSHPATAHELQATTGLTVVQIDRRLPDLLKAGQARVVQLGGDDLMRGGARVWEAA